LGVTVGHRCLARLIGIGTNRLFKAMGGALDLRRFRPRASPKTATIDAYFIRIYMRETDALPDKRRS
jgi:hypothetical protein